MRARKLGTIVLIAVCAAGGLWLFAAVLFPLLLPLFIGLAVAAMARKPVSMLECRTKLPRGLAAFLCVLGIYALFCFFKNCFPFFLHSVSVLFLFVRIIGLICQWPTKLPLICSFNYSI